MSSRCVHFLPRLPKVFLAVPACFILLLFSLHYLDPSAVQPFTKESEPSSSQPSTLHLRPPDDYGHLHDDSRYCARRLGLAYLEELRQSRATYCADASSQVTCFHSQVEADSRIDSFCVGNAARVDKAVGGFKIGCDLAEPTSIELMGESSVPMDHFVQYWYETGPRTIIDKFADFGPHMQPLPQGSRELGTNIILVKREGETNPWHSLMEIMSLSMTLDVLQMTPRDGPGPEGGLPFLAPEDGENTQVVILDDRGDGPFFDLWRLFAKKPTIRLADLAAETDILDIIIPLPGGSNPVWRGDWEPNDCGHSDLLRSFSWRVLHHIGIAEEPRKSSRDSVVVTFIHRLGTRKLVDVEGHLAALQHRYTDAHASIQLIDLAALPFDEQVRVVHDSDVLAGVHGAGLTHGLWMRERSVMVEILPEDFKHKGFRNLAGALGHSYFSTHGS